MIKYQLYYNKENDCLQLVEDGVLQYHEECVHGGNMLDCYLAVENIEELKNQSIENILIGYEALEHDFMGEEHGWAMDDKEEIKGYFDRINNSPIQGELLNEWEYEGNIKKIKHLTPKTI